MGCTVALVDRDKGRGNEIGAFESEGKNGVLRVGLFFGCEVVMIVVPF